MSPTQLNVHTWRFTGYTAASPRMDFSMTRLCLLLFASLIPSTAVQAKDLRGRYGVGFNQQFGHVSALSARYALPTSSHVMNVHLEGNFGLDTGEKDAGGDVFYGARVLYGVLAEDNMNLFVAGGAGGLTNGDTNTVRIQPSIGTDFFLFGLDNLGFTIESGMNLDLGQHSRVRTTASMAAGAHYWF